MKIQQFRLFWKIFVELQLIVHNCSRKKDKDVITHYILLPIYQHTSKTVKNAAKKYRCLTKMTTAVYLNFYELIFFETSVIFLGPTIKLITEISDLQK